MRRTALLAVLGLVVWACTGDAVSDTTNATTPDTTAPIATTNPSASTTSRPVTTSTLVEPVFDRSNLPQEGDCVIDATPQDGEPTVLIGERLYGLGADLASPRCLVEGIAGSDVEWGPAGDRVRIGSSVVGIAIDPLVLGRAEFEWTAPTGSRLVMVIPERVVKIGVEDLEETDITFLETTEAVAYHPAGTHLLAVGSDFAGQYGLWVASNVGTDQLLIAADEGAGLSDPVWSWLNEPLFAAGHLDGSWHIHRVEFVDGDFQGPIVVESDESIDRLVTSPFDPVMLAFRFGGVPGEPCIEGARAAVNGVDLPEPLASYSSTPLGWLSAERLLILAYPDGCDAPSDLWTFSAGFCPGSVYGAELLITDVDTAAPRQAVPPAPPAPDFTGVIDPAPA